MKKAILLFIVIGLLFSCNNDDNSEPELVGSWQLVEILADPGDGSGKFEKVDSKKILEFNADGIVTSNGSITDISTTTSVPSSLRYSETESVIFSDGFASLPFEIIGSNLIVTHLCIEGCQSKYIKI